MAIRKVHHLGIVVRRLDEALRFWRDALGLRVARTASVPEQGVRGALLPAGETEVELLEPIAPDTGVTRFLDRRGEGLHHLCFETDDAEAELAGLASKGLQLLDRAPRPGLAGRIFFLHPRATFGILVELAQPVEAPAEAEEGGVGFERCSLLVDDLVAAKQTFARNFGLAAEGETDRARDGVRAAAYAVGPSRLEILTPLAQGGGGCGEAASILGRRGNTLYELALRVPDLVAAGESLRARGIMAAPAAGHEGRRAAVVEERCCSGVRLRLVERRETGAGAP